jgi:hypothetical protein
MLLPLLAVMQFQGPAHDGQARALNVAAPRLEAQARVDGALDEPVWRRAARLTGFSQYRPVDGRPAEDSTEVLVWYAPDALWFGIRAFEAHGSVVRATLADRDQIDADDYVRILLDTYDDHRRAWMFGVNPLGVQQDGVWSDGVDAGAAGGPRAGGRMDATADMNPDYVFQSRGHLTPAGYEVEVRIPFKSLRYQAADPQTWGLQIIRFVQHSGYENTWAPAVRASASFLAQSGQLTGLTGLRRGVVMDLAPEITTRVDGAPETGGGYGYDATPEAGGTLRWGITPNLNLTGTANPDFSQVEADVGQVTVNERFALFFPEKRPFFLEGLEQYDTPNRLIYTRRIASPLGGAKLTGKIGGTNLAVLSAVDDKTASATGDYPIYNLLRLRRDLGTSSTLGLVYTDRVEGDAYNRALGGDLRLVWLGSWFSAAQLVASRTRTAAGTQSGALWSFTLFDYTGRSYGNHAEIAGISPGFEAASGFVPRTGIVHASLANRFSWYGRPGALLEQFTTFLHPELLWRYDDFSHFRKMLEGSLGQNLMFTLRGGWNLNANWANSYYQFDPPSYAGYQTDSAGTRLPFQVPAPQSNLWAGNLGATTPNRALSATASVGYGEAVIFDEAAAGRQFTLSATASWKPTPSLRSEARWTHSRMTRAQDGSWYSTADIPRLKVEYQLNRSVFVRYVGQYTAQRRAALRDPTTGRPLVIDPATEQRIGRAAGATVADFRNDFLFSYKPTPGTVIFLGYGASLTEPSALRFSNLTRANDGFFFKGSYLFRM